MANESLARLTDIQLMKLFEASTKPIISRRTQQVIAEMERRGYLLDPDRQDFLTCEQWNKRHRDAPLDCDEQARKLKHK